MYDKSDPRAALAPSTAAKPMPTEFAGAQYAKFYETEPQHKTAKASSWLTRGQNFIIEYSDVKDGAVLERKDQIDEYVVLLPDAKAKPRRCRGIRLHSCRRARAR
jgi:hypothetical protein